MAKLPVEKLKASKKQKAVPVRIVSDCPSPSYAKEDQKWRAEDDLRALQRASEIEGDKSRMKAAQTVAKEQMSALSKVTK